MSWIKDQMQLKPCSPPKWWGGSINPQCGITDGQRDDCCYLFEREQAAHLPAEAQAKGEGR